MAVSRKKSKENAEAPASKAQGAAKAATKSQVQLREEERRQKVLDGFHPEVVKFFMDEMGIDLSKLSTSTLFDLQTGKLTEPLEMVVTPLAYDKDGKKKIEMPRIQVFDSLQVILPYANGKAVAPDDKHRIIVTTVPCRPMAEKGVALVLDAPESETKGGRETPSFTEEQTMALEGIGLDRSRLFGGFNHIGKDVKCAIADGEQFFVDGAVKTSFGLVNVIGVAQLSEQGGSPVASFEPFYPQEHTEEMAVDLMDARINGALELDFFRRRPDGRIMTDVNGNPKFNDAYYNLLAYGNALEPVRGDVHRRSWDAKAKKFVDSVESGMYQVSVAPAYRVWDVYEKSWKVFDQGNLVITPMREITYKKGEANAVRYEVSQARTVIDKVIVKDEKGKPEEKEVNKVFVDGQGGAPLEFVSEKDFVNFMAGRGGFVKGAKHHDYSANTDVTYNAFVVAEKSRGGYARLYSPATSKKIAERMDQKAGIVRGRKPVFGIH